MVNFNARGITGNITFTELTNGSIRIQTYLKGLRSGSAKGQAVCLVTHKLCMYVGSGRSGEGGALDLPEDIPAPPLPWNFWLYNHLKFYLNFDAIL